MTNSSYPIDIAQGLGERAGGESSAEENEVAKTNKAADSTKTIQVAADLRVAAAAAAFSALQAAAKARESRVAIDGRAVERIDAAGLQALLVGRRALLESGKSVSWAGCSAQLKSAAELLGLAEPLGIGQ